MEFKIFQINLLLAKCLVILLGVISVLFAIIGKLVAIIERQHRNLYHANRKAEKAADVRTGCINFRGIEHGRENKNPE